MDKYDASRSVGQYFNFLKKEGEIIVIEKKDISGFGNYSSEVKRAFRSSYVYYHFKNDNTIYKAYFPDGDSIQPDEYYELEEKFKQYVEKLKKEGEYYLEDTGIPKFKFSSTEKKFYCAEEFICIADRFKVYTKIFLKKDDVKFLYKNSVLVTEEKIYILTKDGQIEADMENCKVINGLQRGFFSSDSTQIHALAGFNEEKIFFKSNTAFFLFDRKNCLNIPILCIKRDVKDYKNISNSTSIFVAENTRLHAIHSIAEYTGASHDTITFEEAIASIEVIKNYIIINHKTLILIDDNDDEHKERVFQKEIQNISDLEDAQLGINDFVEIDGNFFCNLGEFKIQRENALLEEFLKEHESEVLIDARIANPDDLDSLNNGSILEKEGAKFYPQNKDLEILYSFRDRRNSSPIFKCILINLEMAERILDRGILHLYVKEEMIGRIIGKKGSNINSVMNRLRQKGLKVNRIEIHSI